MKTPWMFVAAMLAALPLAAEKKPAHAWKKEVNAGGNLTEGNSNTFRVNFGFGVKQKAAVTKHEAKLDYQYGESEEKSTVDQIQARLSSRRDYTEASYVVFTTSYLQDQLADIDRRINGGPGIGTKLINLEKTELDVEFGVVWQHEVTPEEKQDGLSFRAAQNFEHQLNDASKVWQSVELVPVVEQVDNYLVNSVLGIETALNSHLHFRVEAKSRYDATPAEGQSTHDLSVIAGISYKL